MQNNYDKQGLVLLILDGVGWQEKDEGNVLLHAEIPNLKSLALEAPFRCLRAHGTAVGLPSDSEMGNSEVGHNALGCGQIYAQGAKLVNQSIESGEIFESATWKKICESVADTHTLHLIGLLSDGSVHSHINHLKALITQAKQEGLRKVAVHILLDGRDVEGQSALIYVDELERHMASLNSDEFTAFIASGGGRMLITMDRYENDWGMVEKGWKTHVLGEGERFSSAKEAIEQAREKDPKLNDQYLPAFVIEKEGEAIAPILDGDAVVLFNFRGDRALELSRAFEGGDDFNKFDRVRVPDVFFVGMLEYDGDLHIPQNYLVQPPRIRHTLTEQMISANIRQYAISETQKFGHVTYFWNGNRQEPFSEELESWEEVDSDHVTFDLKPWMKAYEITEKVIEAMESGHFDFIRANFANGDMVGHTGNYQAATIALETVDLCLGRIKEAVDRLGYQLMVLADHGNVDEMYMPQKNEGDKRVAKTSHTLSPVPFILYGCAKEINLKDDPELGLANVAATIADLLHFDAHESWEESILE